MLGTDIPSIFCKYRFTQIKRYLHFCDESEHKNNDKLYKVKCMLDRIRASFQSEYLPHEQISVDESKGRLSFKQYMKDKPCKFGVKMWMLADSVSTYCWNFDVYVGKHATEIERVFRLSG